MVTGTPAQQQWVIDLPIMQQSVLFAAIRAPDGIRKDHPVKVLCRWYRRCVLLSAFDNAAILDPFAPGGGSFTGPFGIAHAEEFVTRREIMPSEWVANCHRMFDCMRDVYLRHVDELPHHFQLHLMHAAEIVGYEHPDREIREWWRDFYLMIVNDAHLFPETREQMNQRLSDSWDEWRAREVVTAA